MLHTGRDETQVMAQRRWREDVTCRWPMSGGKRTGVQHTFFFKITDITLRMWAEELHHWPRFNTTGPRPDTTPGVTKRGVTGSWWVSEAQIGRWICNSGEVKAERSSELAEQESEPVAAFSLQGGSGRDVMQDKSCGENPETTFKLTDFPSAVSFFFLFLFGRLWIHIHQMHNNT